MQTALSEESVTVKEANDNVILTMDGNLQITGLAIDNSLMTPDQNAKLVNAIKSAHESAMKKMQRIMAMKIKEMGGLPNIPGLS